MEALWMCRDKFKGTLQLQQEAQSHTAGSSCCSTVTSSGTVQFYWWTRVCVSGFRPTSALVSWIAFPHRSERCHIGLWKRLFCHFLSYWIFPDLTSWDVKLSHYVKKRSASLNVLPGLHICVPCLCFTNFMPQVLKTDKRDHGLKSVIILDSKLKRSRSQQHPVEGWSSRSLRFEFAVVAA